ncbi:hypothetical protein Pla52n_55990 [Stieleria varia]|uniref:Uncharacterized protein n=1 Tax=Stieleria varia TaxID=2528005 RepID=A0A5C6A3J1_9BACT|nr:hypothetical protein Pla52n_55990 [Stieleria varia]
MLFERGLYLSTAILNLRNRVVGGASSFHRIELHGQRVFPLPLLFFFTWFGQRTDDVETDGQRVGVIPNAAGNLGILVLSFR